MEPGAIPGHPETLSGRLGQAGRISEGMAEMKTPTKQLYQGWIVIINRRCWGWQAHATKDSVRIYGDTFNETGAKAKAERSIKRKVDAHMEEKRE